MAIPNELHFKKKLDTPDYYLFPMSVAFRDIIHLQCKPSQPTWTIIRFPGLNLLIKIF